MVFTKRQEYELLASISGRGEIPVKFVYLGEGVKRWESIYQHWSKESGITNEEMSLMASHLDSFINAFEGAKGINLIDLGAGNGIPAIFIIEKLVQRGFEVHYVAVDISPEMLELAQRNVSAKIQNISATTLLLDFEKDSLANSLLDLRQSNDFSNFMINLGNTLGNYVNASGTLSNFLESMTTDDYLLIDNGLVNDYNPQKIIDDYNIDIIIDLVTTPARTLGIYGSADEFKYLWNPLKNRLEGRVKLGENKVVDLAGRKLSLKKR